MALRFSRAPSWGRAAAFLAPALWFSMTRPNVFVIRVVLAFGLGVIGLVRGEALRGGTETGSLGRIAQ